MSIVSDDLPDYITAGDIFDFADVDLLDVEDVIQEGNDGLFILSHATHGELVIIESDMSSAPAGEVRSQWERARHLELTKEKGLYLTLTIS